MYIPFFSGVKPYKCKHCGKSFTQRCSLESHTRKVHGDDGTYQYKQRRSKLYVCEECGYAEQDAEVFYKHLSINHPNSPSLQKFNDKRHFKFQNDTRPSVVLPRTWLQIDVKY